MNFNLHPKFLFPGQQPDEQIYLVTRQHWIVFAKKLMVWLIFVALLLGFDSVVAPGFPELAQPPTLQVINLVKSVYLMFVVAGLFFLWTIYYLNFQIVTNERIVDVDQRTLLHHTTSELHLTQIQDVTADVNGILGNIFNFGSVYVQTAGMKALFEFEQVPNPHAVAKLILDLHEKVIREHRKLHHPQELNP